MAHHSFNIQISRCVKFCCGAHEVCPLLRAGAITAQARVELEVNARSCVGPVSGRSNGIELCNRDSTQGDVILDCFIKGFIWCVDPTQHGCSDSCLTQGQRLGDICCSQPGCSAGERSFSCGHHAVTIGVGLDHDEDVVNTGDVIQALNVPGDGIRVDLGYAERSVAHAALPSATTNATAALAS